MKKEIKRDNYTLNEALTLLGEKHECIETWVFQHISITLFSTACGETYSGEIRKGAYGNLYVDFGRVQQEPPKALFDLLEYIEGYIQRYTGRDYELKVRLTVVSPGQGANNGS